MAGMDPAAAAILYLLLFVGGIALAIWACVSLATIARNSREQVRIAKYSAERLEAIQNILGTRNP
jgi:hypothetical protein